MGETYNFTGFVTPSKATDVSLVWRSNNETVATVDQQGKVTGVFEGNATLTCTDEGSGKFAEVEVIVNPTHQGGLLIYPNSTTTFFTAKLENAITSYKIYDYLGNVRQSQENLKAKELVIQVDRLLEGVFILQVTDDLGATHSKLFIKKQ